jgi:hypothetical protein
MAKRETFFNIIQSSKYLDEFDLKSKEKQEKTFQNGCFRLTCIKQYFGDELEICIQYTNLHYLYENKLNHKLTKNAFHKEAILWKCYVFDAEYVNTKNMYCKVNKIKDGLIYTNFNVSKYGHVSYV